MTKIDLKRANAVNFELHTDFVMSAETFNPLFGEYSEQFRRRPIYFANVYSRQNTKHIAISFLGETEEEQEYHLYIQYRTTIADVSVPPESIWKLEKAFNLLRPIVGICEFNAETRFVYPLSKFYSSMRLPISLASDTSSDFDEIWGLHLAKLTSDGKVKFEIFIDQDDEDITHNIDFTYKGELTADTILGAFNAGVNISERFIKLLTPDEIEA